MFRAKPARGGAGRDPKFVPFATADRFFQRARILRRPGQNLAGTLAQQRPATAGCKGIGGAVGSPRTALSLVIPACREIVRRQIIWDSWRRKLAECWPHLGVDV